MGNDREKACAPGFRRIALGAALVALGVAAFAALPHGGVTFASAAADARAFAAHHPTHAAAGFSLAYVILAALAVPVVGAMTIAGGALFGPWLGVPLAVASGVAGATIAMLVVRHSLRQGVEARFPHLKAWLDGGADGHGAALLFAARVTPVMPFALVNVAAGISRMPARTFALVSAAGALPLAAIYASAGATLGAAGSPADLLTPRFAVLLALAGATPLAGRVCAGRIAHRRRRTAALFQPH